MASGNSTANQRKNQRTKNGRGARSGYKAYLNEDRRWHNKLARLERKFNNTGPPKYQRDHESVLARAPIQVRNKYKTQRLAAE